MSQERPQDSIVFGVTLKKSRSDYRLEKLRRKQKYHSSEVHASTTCQKGSNDLSDWYVDS